MLCLHTIINNFHLVDPIPWPLTAAIGGFTLTIGALHKTFKGLFNTIILATMVAEVSYNQMDYVG